MMNGVMQMNAAGNRNETAHALRNLAIIILVIGLVVVIGQTLWISKEVSFNEQSDLLGSLCYIAVGMAIEFFGIGLIIFSNRK